MKPIYKLRDWIDKNKLNLKGLSENPNSGSILKDIILDQDCWTLLSENENDEIFDILEKNIDKIDWRSLSKNKNSRIVKLFSNNMDKINWGYLCDNNSNGAMDIIKMFI